MAAVVAIEPADANAKTAAASITFGSLDMIRSPSGQISS
jgi:hypothetical protein